MRLFILFAAFCILSTGCNGNDKADPKETKAAPVYEAILKEELKGTKKGEGFYVFVDGKSPAPELLKRFQKQWPELQPGAKVPQGKTNRVSFASLKWINHDTAELVGGTSNGIDGRHSRYRVVRKDGDWVVESVKVESES